LIPIFVNEYGPSPWAWVWRMLLSHLSSFLVVGLLLNFLQHMVIKHYLNERFPWTSLPLKKTD
jgi:hypothetical protein